MQGNEAVIVQIIHTQSQKSLLHRYEVGKVSGNSIPKLVERCKPAVWLGKKSDLTDEHLVRTEDGIVCTRSVRRVKATTLVGREPPSNRQNTTGTEVNDLYLTLQPFLPYSNARQRETWTKTPQLDQPRTKTKKCRRRDARN